MSLSGSIRPTHDEEMADPPRRSALCEMGMLLLLACAIMLVFSLVVAALYWFVPTIFNWILPRVYVG